MEISGFSLVSQSSYTTDKCWRFDEQFAGCRTLLDLGAAPFVFKGADFSWVYCWQTSVTMPLVPHPQTLEREARADQRSNIAVVVVRHAGSVRNGNRQAAAYIGAGNSGETVQTLREVIVHVERTFIQRSGAGAAEARGRGALRRTAEIVLPLLIPGDREIGLRAEGVLHARPPDL
jgi:hypothetical protein